MEVQDFLYYNLNMKGVFRIFIQCVVFNLVQAVNKEPLFNWFKGLESENVVIAINCGAEEDMVDLSGVTFVKDQNF